MKKEMNVTKSIGNIAVKVEAVETENNARITIVMPDGETRLGMLSDLNKALKFYSGIKIGGRLISGLSLSDEQFETIKSYIKEVEQHIKEREHKKFLENKQKINHFYGYGYSLSTRNGKCAKEYSQAALKKVYEENKIKNPKYDLFDDGYSTSYIFPEILGSDLLDLLDKAEAELEAKKQENKAKKEREVSRKFEKAKETGRPVLIEKSGGISTENFDTGWAWVYKTYAMPDGTTETVKEKEVWD
ncbi:MAG TPA: hypothetical protein GX745_01890 [Clostridiales bacterium]|nr:hypothetical protein [Clostridiales bacterium]